MHKILLVDDEPLFLKRLNHIIDWGKYDCTIFGEALDGVEALEKMKTLQPDIVILDISIPYIDGLKICEIVQEWPRKPHIIISTAHDTFDFAHRAIKLGVSDYLLKPFDEKDIKNALKKCFVQISNEFTTQLLQKKNEEDEASRYFRYLLSHDEMAAIPVSLSSEDTQAWSISMILHHFPISMIEAEKKVQAFLSTLTTIHSFIAGTINDAIIVVNLMKRPMELNELIELYQQYEEKEKDRGITFSFGETVDNPALLKFSLNTATKGMENRIQIKKRWISNLDVQELQNEQPSYRPEDMTLLIRYFEEHQYDKADAIMSRIFGIQEGHALSFQYVAAVCYSLMGIINAHYGMERKSSDEYATNNTQLLRELNICETQNEVMEIIKNHIHELFSDHLSFSKTTRTEQLVAKIQHYLELHYMNPDLTVTMVSDSLFFENSYIRRVYKSHTGKTINQELEDIRIKKAMEFLKKCNLKHNEIAKLVGYSNPFYFSRRFKLATNLSPSEFQSCY